MLPVLGAGGSGRSELPAPPSRFLKDDAVFVSSARAAIAQALRAAGVQAGDCVLMPAYHCGSMIEPALWLGARPVFYRVHGDLTIDVQDFSNRLSRSVVKAAIIAHYFGFPQELTTILAACQDQGVAVIEDCAHAFFGSVEGGFPGNKGDFAVASIPKFFPVQIGGVFCSNRDKRDCRPLHLKPSGLRAEVMAVVDMVDNASDYGRLAVLGRVIDTLRSFAGHIRKISRSHAVRDECDERGSWRWFDPSTVDAAMPVAVRVAIRLTRLADNAYRRRENFLCLARYFRGYAGVRSLHPALPDGVVPYVFPLLVDDPDSCFVELKQKGIPIWRWEELAVSDCAVSQHYRTHLFQLPCHQGLRRDELEWIAQTVIDIAGTDAINHTSRVGVS